ncbi:MAG: hypothetical protein LBT01_06295 [Spirochaetaceae bacterium]|jgi:hypothetical protein|nr:hypothetical protein [Spirochaetaceae bacterium]
MGKTVITKRFFKAALLLLMGALLFSCTMSEERSIDSIYCGTYTTDECPENGLTLNVSADTASVPERNISISGLYTDEKRPIKCEGGGVISGSWSFIYSDAWIRADNPKGKVGFVLNAYGGVYKLFGIGYVGGAELVQYVLTDSGVTQVIISMGATGAIDITEMYDFAGIPGGTDGITDIRGKVLPNISLTG